MSRKRWIPAGLTAVALLSIAWLVRTERARPPARALAPEPNGATAVEAALEPAAQEAISADATRSPVEAEPAATQRTAELALEIRVLAGAKPAAGAEVFLIDRGVVEETRSAPDERAGNSTRPSPDP